jgi:hypothetical protein
VRFWLGVFVGAVLMALYAYRSQISDIIHNRRAISAGEKTFEGLKELLGEL